MPMHIADGAMRTATDVCHVLVTKVAFARGWFGRDRTCCITLCLPPVRVPAAPADATHAAWRKLQEGAATSPMELSAADVAGGKQRLLAHEVLSAPTVFHDDIHCRNRRATEGLKE